MGSGFSRLVVPSCFKTAPENHHPDLIFSSSEPWDETLGHSFCYVRSSSPSHSSRRFLSPSHSLRLSETALKTRTAPSSETAFKSISGASVGANTSTPRTILQPDVIYQNATDPLARLNSSGFESSASFSSLPLQPVPRLCAPSDASGPLDRGFFMSGPIERGALSGPLDVATGGDIHFSAPLGGVYVKNRKKKGFPGGSVRKALSRSFSEKKRPWVVPVLNFVGRRDSTAAAEASDLEANSENVQWAHGKAGEDRVHVVVSEDHGWLFVGIYDGFNGPDAPEFLMGHLYRAVFNELEGLFWETIEEDSSSVLTQEEDNRILENAVVVDERNLSRDIADGEQDCCNKTGDDSVEFSECSKDLSPPPLSCGSVKRVTFESEQKMDSRRGKTLWEFLAEVDEDEGLDLSGSDRFSFSINNLFRVKNGSSVASRRSVLFSKLKFGASREKESQRKLFPCRFDWEEKEKIEVDNRVEEKLQRSLRRCKVGPADHDSVLSALSRALDITEVSYLEMTDKVLDRNPELALMGSCLLVVLMKDEDVYVMNVGDSRAIVAQYKPQPIGSCSELKGQGKDGLESEGIVEESGGLRDGAEPVEVEQTDEIMKLTALQLSMDHSTSIEEEVLRIKAEHPDDCQCIVNDRVKGRLKVTRAFGAGFLKQPKWNNTLLEMFRNEYIGTAPYITCSPSLCHHKLGPNDQFLVLSSDGLYQYLSNQEVVSHVENFMEKFPDGDPAQHLIEELLFRAARKAGMDFHELLDIPQGDRRKYHDDVTVMVISLEGRIWKSSGKYV
ncbi:protein phosphatase 2C 29 isoform X1 [Magnolia sinica]|uniref:protein phosphatase 2C 29 isoform X1 n=1 Tax=Magnolia sinica TaxID=86752 RepID=UPI00265A9C3A|nr:protein phosphatase 2C 29 isoform X1 [Magnolia sinica]